MSVLEGTGRKVSLVRPKGKIDRPVSLVIVADVLRLLDIAVICGTAVLVHGLYLGGSELEHARIYPIATVIAAFAAGMTFHWNGLYRLQGLAAGQLKLGKLAASWSIVVLGLIVLGFALKVSSDVSRLWIGLWFAAALAGMAGVRGALCLRARRWVAEGRLARNIAIVGGGEHGERLVASFLRAGDEGINVIGVFDDRGDRVAAAIAGVPRIGTVEELVTYARYNRVDQIIVALPWAAEARVLQILKKLRSLPVDIRLAPDLVGFRLLHATYSHVGGVPLLNVFHKPLADWKLIAKEI
jgi:FlaA1/EpsC-like NDP-sugar epimerase